MINEKFLDSICTRPEDWKIVATEDELSDLIRLARLGLLAEKESWLGMRNTRMRNKELANWAEQHAKPALEYYSLIHESLEEQRIISGAPAREALAAYPTPPKA